MSSPFTDWPETLAPALAHVRTRIAAHAQGRDIRLVAVSKTKPIEAIRALAECGQRVFGENYVQEALTKSHALRDLALEWHCIGPLQSNKCRDVALHFAWLQTLDREKLIDLLAQHREPVPQPLNVLIQVNIDDESSKSGIAPAQLLPLATRVRDAGRALRLRGLMAIPAPRPDWQQRRKALLAMHDLFQRLQDHTPGCDTLSLGMSEDFELAIDCGANLVRIGSALFGAR